MAANTEFRRGDSEHDLLRKILNSLGPGAPADGSALAALLAEMTQKTEPTDAQLVRVGMALAAAEFARPADLTAYAPNDVVGTSPGTVMTFASVGRVAGGSGYITNARLVKSTATITGAYFRLWLYSVAPTAIADNSPFTLLYAYRANRLGYVDLVCGSEGTGSDSASALAVNVNLKFDCADGTTSLFGVLEAKQAYSPGSAETFWIELTADQN